MQNALLIIAFLAAATPLIAAVPSSKETPPPYTSFQTPTGYRPDHDIQTGAVIVYSNDAARIKSWQANGFFVQTMYGFRTGADYIKDHADEGQTDKNGTILTCGPGSHYMVPTESRIQAAVQYFTNAISGGAQAVCPEEPEFFERAGYSESFKRAWQAYYGEPWQDQTSSIEARWKSERLKAHMEYSMVKAIADSAAKQKPSVRRMVACHSAVNYYCWNIIYPHYECMMIPNLQEIIGQVWTGTARSACRYAGKMEERTFETGFLEYSSLANLTRGTGKRMWFLMDPLEDNPDRSMEDYHINYEKTLIASLLFPEVDAYEVMPWPDRIYGRVPDEFATEISSIINALEDMHNQKTVKYDTGTRGIATFVADSMGWQRGAPHAGNYDCFWGLTLPLVYKGIPIQVAQLERVVEKDYLKPYKVILLSYDIMKPMKPEYNQAIADWVKQGGVLVFFGGEDAYNALPEWWTKKGLYSPQIDLYFRLAHDDAHPTAKASIGLFRSLDESSPLFARDPGTPANYPMTVCPSTGKHSEALIGERRVGVGMLIHVGVSPSYFASSVGGGLKLRDIIRYACARAGINYKEQPRLGIRRGNYVAMRTFGASKTLKGSYVNILDPKLAVIADPVIAADKCALYRDVTKDLTGSPKLLFSSSKVRGKVESAQSTKLTLSGPLKTKGVARIYTGGKSVDSIEPADVKVEQSGDTLLLTYDNKPESVSITITYKQ